MSKRFSEDMIWDVLLGRTPARGVIFVQAPRRKSGEEAPEEDRCYVAALGTGYDPFIDAVLALMAKERGGYSDRYDPMGLVVVRKDSKTERGGHHHHASAFVGGNHLSIKFLDRQWIFQREGLSPTPLLTVSTPFDWSVLNDEGFERLIFSLLMDMDEFEQVKLLTKTHAPDAGRDISAFRPARQMHVMVQCRHQRASLGPADVQACVAKAQTWRDPPFDELMIATTSTFTSDAVRWYEAHNADAWPVTHLGYRNQGRRPWDTVERFVSQSSARQGG
jgi:Restriction endonuclease